MAKWGPIFVMQVVFNEMKLLLKYKKAEKANGTESTSTNFLEWRRVVSLKSTREAYQRLLSMRV